MQHTHVTNHLCLPTPLLRRAALRRAALEFATLARAALGLVALGLAASPAQAQTTLYSQTAVPSGVAYASQNDTTPSSYGNFATVYDDFTLGSSSTITGITWQGAFFNDAPQSITSKSNTSKSITSFNLTFYASSPTGRPGKSVATETVIGSANQTFVANGTGRNTGVTFEDYSAAFIPSFTADAGTTYWLSIEPNLPFQPQWGWSAGTGGDGTSYQNFFGTRSKLNTDLAFSLTGKTVSAAPEPAAVTVWASAGLGLTGLVLAARKKRAKKRAAASWEQSEATGAE